jgi:hypothetical protein
VAFTKCGEFFFTGNLRGTIECGVQGVKDLGLRY